MVERKNNKLTTSLSILMASSILYSGISGASSVVNSNTQNFRQQLLVDNIYLTENDSFSIDYINNAVIGRPAGFTGFYEYTLDYSVYKDFNKKTLKPGTYPFKVTWGNYTQNVYIIVSPSIKNETKIYNAEETKEKARWIPEVDRLTVEQYQTITTEILLGKITNKVDTERYKIDFDRVDTAILGDSVVEFWVTDKNDNTISTHYLPLSVTPPIYKPNRVYINKGDVLPDLKTIYQTALPNINKNSKVKLVNEKEKVEIDTKNIGEYILKVNVDQVEVEIPISVIEKQGTVDNYKQNPLENTYFATTVFLLSLLGVIFGILKFAKWEK